MQMNLLFLKMKQADSGRVICRDASRTGHALEGETVVTKTELGLV